MAKIFRSLWTFEISSTCESSVYITHRVVYLLHCESMYWYTHVYSHARFRLLLRVLEKLNHKTCKREVTLRFYSRVIVRNFMTSFRDRFLFYTFQVNWLQSANPLKFDVVSPGDQEQLLIALSWKVNEKTSGKRLNARQSPGRWYFRDNYKNHLLSGENKVK